jgi:hypothetical protein
MHIRTETSAEKKVRKNIVTVNKPNGCLSTSPFSSCGLDSCRCSRCRLNSCKLYRCDSTAVDSTGVGSATVGSITVTRQLNIVLFTAQQL